MIAALIYPHQLFLDHPAIKGADRIYLIEEPLLWGTDSEWPARMHVKKLILHRASILRYKEKLGEKAEILQNQGAASSFEPLDEIPRDVKEVRICEVIDNVLDRRLKVFCEKRQLKLTISTSPNFVTPRDWGHGYFDKGKKPFMAPFYEAQRKRMGILIEPDGSPTGGKWSFDAENRFKLPKKVDIPTSPFVRENEVVKDARNYVLDSGADYWGDADDFTYPTNHEEAQEWFEDFLKYRFMSFGTYEDALSTRGTFLFHSVITPMLNIGLLCPAWVTNRAIEYGVANDIEINNIEGFVRQVIGWREFMKLMYERHGTFLRNQNFWGFEASVPAGMYEGNTGILPVDLAIQRLKKFAYTHHIDRLMVLGNFLMLLRVKPDDVYRWFMEVYIDSYDWVMVPNVYGMSQFSDGGLLVTKPYISGSNYIRKMSDYPAGEWCKAWDALFWSFVDDHKEFFSKQYRMKMMLSHLTKMSSEKLAQHHKIASDVRLTLAAGETWGEKTLL